MLGATPPCIPSWIHTLYAERLRAKAAGVLDKPLGAVDGCQVTSEGIVNCDPEGMRSRTEARIKALGLYPRDRKLSLDAYSIARNIRSEGGDGRAAIPVKVVYAEAALNRIALGDKGNRTISELVMRDGKHYGKQRGTNPSVASSHDPTWDDIVIAEMLLAGDFGGYGRGTTHYFSPRIMDAWHAKGKAKDAAATFETWSHGWNSTRDGWIWVGDIPGVDHHEHFLMKMVPLKSAEWKEGYALGKKAIRTSSSAAVVPCDSAEDYNASRTASAFGVMGSLMIAVFLGGTLGVFFGSYFGQEAASSRRASERRRI